MVDGLGKNSWGIRPAGARGRLNGKEGKELAGFFMQEVHGWLDGKSKRDRLRLLAVLALGKASESPFSMEIKRMRERLDEKVRSLGRDPERRQGDRETEINFRRLLAWARLCEEEDAEYLEMVASGGVPLGLFNDIPRVKPVYDENPKVQMEGGAEVRWLESEGVRDNYSSAEDHMAKVEEHLEEDLEKGWLVKMSLKEARELYPGQGLQLAALGAVPKDPAWDDIRVVHDGTHGISLNKEIKQPNRMAFPQFDDLEACMRAFRDGGAQEKFLLAFDIKAAHRLVPVRREDWGRQGCRGSREDVVYLNTRGTFGVASAAFWWGRVAGTCFRVLHRVMPPDSLFYLLLFADDGLILSGGERYQFQVVAILLFLEVMEMPLSWKKCRGGFETEWIGYQVDLRSWTVGVSDKKVAWLIEWVGRLVREGHVLGREFKAGVGRMGFLAGAVKNATSARVAPTAFVTLHMAVKLALEFFGTMVVQKPRKVVSSLPRVLGEVFRVDAMADQEGIAVGGWESYGGVPTAEARWFSLKLTKKNAPWLYVKGEPFRVIAAAELVGVLIALVVFGKEACWRCGAGRLMISGFTDNLGNSFVLDRFLAMKFPMNVVLMEVANQLERLELELDLSWVPREQNEESDRLSKGCFDGFDERRRMEVNLEDCNLPVIAKLMEVAQSLDEEIVLRKTSKEAKAYGGKAKAHEKMRLTQPW